MFVGDRITGVLPEAARGSVFLEEICLPFLLRGQNADGGWSFHAGAPSRVEPTCWALLALGRVPDAALQAIQRAEEWLLRAQLPDGSWPAASDRRTGCWLTALACLALRGNSGAIEATARGRAWVSNAWPAEGGLGWRMACWLFGWTRPVQQKSSLRGWSWTPRTASWVEPTAYALILLQSVPEKLRTPGAEKRRRLGEAMLYDRMCPSGGWNSGNPLVYGVAGIPRILPTAWALLALRNYGARSENQKSLDWLERNYHDIEGPGSLALAHLCLQTCGRTAPPLEAGLQKLYARNGFFANVAVMSWAALALTGIPGWLT